MTVGVLDALARLAMAAALTGLIGFEREAARKAAGFRTHMLVGLGAALFSLISVEGFPGADPSRVAAQVVSGIGFLGAGAIFREGATVRGLTTAAALWAVAAIGMAAGIGELPLAVAGTVVAIVVLYGMRAVDRWLRHRIAPNSAVLEVSLADTSQFSKLWKLACQIDPTIDDVTFEKGRDQGGVVYLQVDETKAPTLMNLFRSLDTVESVSRVD